MPDEHNAENAKHEAQVAELVGRVGNIYTRFNLSPPTALRDAAKGWAGLSQVEMARVVEEHLREHRRLYLNGSGDRCFYMVESAIRKAWQAKRLLRDHLDGEPVRPRRRSSSRVQKIHNASGFPDVIMQGRAARLVRNQVSNVQRLVWLSMNGTGVPIGEDDVD
jgi:hypothetical protein